MGTSNSGHASLARATEQAEQRIGTIPVKSRYHRLPMRLEKDYEVDYEHKLGTGMNGTVYLARRQGSHDRYAVKTFIFSNMGSEKLAFLRNEVEIFLSMDHPNVARLVDVYESESQLSLVMECMDGGELFTRVKNQDGLAESDAADATLHMLRAVNYMHARGLVHRDLKLENFMYERAGADALKIIDFGFSKPWHKEDPDMHERLGTSHYVAPEVLDGRYTSQCDIWSLGVIVFMLLSGCRPFEDQNAAMQGRCTFKRDRWANVSAAALDFVQKLLTVSPAHRLTAAQALDHPWLAEARARQEGRQQEQLDESIVASLNSFVKKTPHKRKFLEFMAWLLTSAERAEASDAFLTLDKSNTGVISRDDMATTLGTQFAVSIDQCHAIVDALDSNKQGCIDYSKFLAAMHSHITSRLGRNEQLLRRAHERFDVDKNVMLTTEERLEIASAVVVIDNAVTHTSTDVEERLAIASVNEGSQAYMEAATAASATTAASTSTPGPSLSPTPPTLSPTPTPTSKVQNVADAATVLTGASAVAGAGAVLVPTLKPTATHGCFKGIGKASFLPRNWSLGSWLILGLRLRGIEPKLGKCYR